MIRNQLADNNPFFMSLVELGVLARIERFKGHEYLEVWTVSTYDRGASTPIRVRINEACKKILLDN